MELKFSPHRAFCEAVQAYLGSTPSPKFLESYWEVIEKTPFTFLSSLIRGWVKTPFDDGRMRRDDEAAVHAVLDPEMLSVIFLLKIEPERFLEFAYFDVLGRPLDTADSVGYDNIDFTIIQNRLAVLTTLIHSQEAEGRPLEFVSEEDHQRITKDRESTYDAKANLLTNGVLMGKAVGLGSYDRKFPLLWKPQDSGTLFCAFGMVTNIKSDDGKPVSGDDWVFFGPKGPLAAGQYNLRVDIVCQGNDLFHFDVVHKGGTKEIKSMKFFGSIDTKLLMTLDEDVDDLEVRLANLNGRVVSIDIKEVSLAPISI